MKNTGSEKHRCHTSGLGRRPMHNDPGPMFSSAAVVLAKLSGECTSQSEPQIDVTGTFGAWK